MEYLNCSQMQLAALTFFANEQKAVSKYEPVSSPLNSVQIYGRFQLLKSLSCPYLCQYLDLIRGHHERVIIISQVSGQNLQEFERHNAIDFDFVSGLAFKVLKALKYLAAYDIVHRNLNPKNIFVLSTNHENEILSLLNPAGIETIKLFNYGLNYLSKFGELASFSFGKTKYSIPDELVPQNKQYCYDIWSLGVILAELSLGKKLWDNYSQWSTFKSSIIELVTFKSPIFQQIAIDNDCFYEFENIPEKIRNLIEDCFQICKKDYLNLDDLLNKDLFKKYREFEKRKRSERELRTLPLYSIQELYNLWQLCDSDILRDLKAMNLMITPIEAKSLLSTDLFESVDESFAKISLKILCNTFSDLKIIDYYPLVYSKLRFFDEDEYIQQFKKSEDFKVLVHRENNPKYQFNRIMLFRKLLHVNLCETYNETFQSDALQFFSNMAYFKKKNIYTKVKESLEDQSGYPFTRQKIIEESDKDIPPLYRGDIWAAILNVRRVHIELYDDIDKVTEIVTDRQIAVDVPRCHQYNELMSSPDGHEKLKQILKAWVVHHHEYVYWQGLDSLVAPFLYLNFSNEAKAFASVSLFIKKFLYKFFLKDNGDVIQEYLRKFLHLIAFHDPLLAAHLHEINFVPELFAIPWFLTMFSHIFPLHKIMHLWDKLLLCDSSYPLHVGLALLNQLRSTMLSLDFNESILLFSDLPDFHITECVHFSIETYNITPKSITERYYSVERDSSKTTDFVPVNQLKNEYCSRINIDDFLEFINRFTLDSIKIVILHSSEINGSTTFLDYLHADINNINLESFEIDEIFGKDSACLKNHNFKLVVIASMDDEYAMQFATCLIKNGIKKVCVFKGGLKKLKTIIPIEVAIN